MPCNSHLTPNVHVGKYTPTSSFRTDSYTIATHPHSTIMTFASVLARGIIFIWCHVILCFLVPMYLSLKAYYWITKWKYIFTVLGMAVTWCLAFLLSVTPATRETVNETPPAPVNVLSIIFNLFWAVFVFTVDASGWLAGPALQLAAMFLGGPVFTTLVNFFVVVDSDFWIPPVFSRARTILGMGRGQSNPAANKAGPSNSNSVTNDP